MCKIVLVLLFSLVTGNNFAQDYFVLIQSDNRQPFYVRLGGQLYPSSPEGHLILSQLKDSTYTVTIGFSGRGEPSPSGKSREQTYSFGAIRKDQELVIKDQDGAGWGLYDLQAKEWLTALSRSGGREEVRALGVRKDDAFSRMMAGVVQDTAVLYNNYAVANLAVADTPAAKPSGGATSTASAGSPAPADSTAPSTTTALTVMTPAGKPAPDTVLAAVEPVKPADTLTAAVIPVTSVKPADTSSSTTISIQPAATPAQPAATTPNPPTAIPAKPTAADSSAHVDSAATTAALARPVSGTPQHHAAPMVDSAARSLLSRPTPDSPARPLLSRPTPDSSARPLTSEVVKLSERKLAHSVRQVYADKGNGARADTVVVIIPVDTPAVATARNHGPNPDSPAVGQNNTAPVHVIVPTPVTAAGTPRNADSAQKKPTKSPLPYYNSDCHAFATDYDVDKLRVKMLLGAKDEERIAAATKVFKTKCFFTRQIRALSEVFTTDAAKFRFFETAYPFAADDHFKELGSLLADPVYANKFKALMGGR